MDRRPFEFAVDVNRTPYFRSYAEGRRRVEEGDDEFPPDARLWEVVTDYLDARCYFTAAFLLGVLHGRRLRDDPSPEPPKES